MKGTIVLFSSGSFRVMGCVDATEASFLAFHYIKIINCDDIPEIYSQLYTSRTKLGYNANLLNLCRCVKTLFEPE